MILATGLRLLDKQLTLLDHITYGAKMKESYLRFLYMLECIGSPCLSVPVSSVYTHVPPMQSAFSNTTGSNKFGFADKYLAAHRPAAPAPITHTRCMVRVTSTGVKIVFKSD